MREDVLSKGGNILIKNRSQHSIQEPRKLNYAALCFQSTLIVCIVASHVNSTGFNGPLDLFPLQSYFVQGFAFISGYLYSAKHDKRPINYCIGRVRRLLVPAFLIYLAYGVLVTFLRTIGFINMGSPITFESLTIRIFDDGHQFDLNAPMWFLGPFFLSQCLNVLLRASVAVVTKHLKNKTVIVDMVILLCSIAFGVITLEIAGTDFADRGSIGLLFGRTAMLVSWIAIGRSYCSCFEERIDRMPGGGGFSLCCLIDCPAFGVL